MVAGVTAGLAESNGSLPPGLWFTSPAGWLPRTGISSGTLRLVIEYGLPLPFLPVAVAQSSSVAMCFVLLILSMASCLLIVPVSRNRQSAKVYIQSDLTGAVWIWHCGEYSNWSTPGAASNQGSLICTVAFVVFSIWLWCVVKGGLVAEWLACWTQSQKGMGSNRSRDAVR